MSSLSHDFLRFAIEKNVLRFGEFTTKAGRQSPYFFNSGLFQDGSALDRLANFYAARALIANLSFDMLFGPAYKGIPLVAAMAVVLAQQGHNFPYAFNRKEAKDHGEGGTVVGAPIKGNVLIVDDVISAGTSIRESVELIRAQGAKAVGVVIALDRMERGAGEQSAVQEVAATYGIPVLAIANLADLLDYLKDDADLAQYQPAVEAYRAQYGV